MGHLATTVWMLEVSSPLGVDISVHRTMKGALEWGCEILRDLDKDGTVKALFPIEKEDSYECRDIIDRWNALHDPFYVSTNEVLLMD